MTAQVVDTRKRASFSSEAGPVSRQPTISEGLLHAAPAAALSSAIADFIHKGGHPRHSQAGQGTGGQEGRSAETEANTKKSNITRSCLNSPKQ